MMPLRPESDFEINIKDIEKVLRFPMVIHTPPYGKQFRSNDFSKLAVLLKFFSEQNCASCDI
jgi:predicted RNA methylase